MNLLCLLKLKKLMKKILNYITVLSLSLFVFGCGGPTIDMNSVDRDDLDLNFGSGSEPGELSTYKGVPITGSVGRFNDDGQLSFEKFFKEGIEDGLEVNYDASGQLVYKKEFKDGKEVFYESYLNGRLQTKTTIYKDGVELCTESYHENGQVYRRNTIITPKTDSTYAVENIEFYDENGNIDVEQTEENNRKGFN